MTKQEYKAIARALAETKPSWDDVEWRQIAEAIGEAIGKNNYDFNILKFRLYAGVITLDEYYEEKAKVIISV